MKCYMKCYIFFNALLTLSLTCYSSVSGTEENTEVTEEIYNVVTIEDANSTEFEEKLEALNETLNVLKILISTNESERKRNDTPNKEEIKFENLNIETTTLENKIKANISNMALEANKDCSRYKNTELFEQQTMADVWQTVYEHTQLNVPCFKMFIRIVTNEEKKFYETTFSSFNGIVAWNNCDMEIKSDRLGRRHFLQRSNTTHGVFENVIIIGNETEEGVILHQESADQWLVVKNLLLMRDCDDGDIVVFSRFPFHPSHGDIIDALNNFGEKSMEGRVICEED